MTQAAFGGRQILAGLKTAIVNGRVLAGADKHEKERNDTGVCKYICAGVLHR